MTADSAIPKPPTDKRAIDQALAELDAAVADWAAAMTEDTNVSVAAVRDLIASRREALAAERNLLRQREMELSRREELIAERESGFTSADDDVQAQLECEREEPARSKAACDESDAAIPGAHVEVRQCKDLDLYESIDRAAKAAGGLVPYVAHRNQKREWLVVVRADDLPRLADCVGLMSGRGNADAGPNQRQDHYQPPTPCAGSQNLRDSTT